MSCSDHRGGAEEDPGYHRVAPAGTRSKELAADCGFPACTLLQAQSRFEQGSKRHHRQILIPCKHCHRLVVHSSPSVELLLSLAQTLQRCSLQSLALVTVDDLLGAMLNILLCLNLPTRSWAVLNHHARAARCWQRFAALGTHAAGHALRACCPPQMPPHLFSFSLVLLKNECIVGLQMDQ